MKKEIRESLMREIKRLESQYSVNLSEIENLQEKQKDITSRINIILQKFK